MSTCLFRCSINALIAGQAGRLDAGWVATVASALVPRAVTCSRCAESNALP
jgi:hypothetical protein